MDRFAVGEKDYPQVTVFRLGNLHPPTDAAVRLDGLFGRRPNSSLDPLVSNSRSIGTRPQSLEIKGGLQRGGVWSCSLNVRVNARAACGASLLNALLGATGANSTTS